jgi:FAD:protein FMN transferase
MTATHVTRAWSCTGRLVVEDPAVLPAASADLDALLTSVDRVASRFRADSALSIANARAGRPTPVPRLLVDLVQAGLDAAELSGGAVDPTVGLALRRIGYDRDFADVDPDGPESGSPPARGGAWQRVRLYRDEGLLTVPTGTVLDLGATAKAYVADRAATALSTRYRTAVMVELGGDVAVAGHRPDGWCIQVAEREGEDGQLVLLRYGGLTTSTTTVRRWTRGGVLMHHIVDPRTGSPAAGPWRTATVAAPCALAANVASTAAIVLGDEAVGWLEGRGIAARLVHRDGTVRRTEGWPAPRRTAALAVA